MPLPPRPYSPLGSDLIVPFRGSAISSRLLPICNSQTPEGNGVALLRDRRDTMLPLQPRRSLQEISRPGLQNQRVPSPACAGLAAKSECARGEQRYADDILKHRTVLVPTNGRAGRIVRQKHL